MNFTRASNDMEMIERALKLSILIAISRHPAILQKVSYPVTALPPTQVTVKRQFSSFRIIWWD